QCCYDHQNRTWNVSCAEHQSDKSRSEVRVTADALKPPVKIGLGEILLGDAPTAIADERENRATARQHEQKFVRCKSEDNQGDIDGRGKRQHDLGILAKICQGETKVPQSIPVRQVAQPNAGEKKNPGMAMRELPAPDIQEDSRIDK